MLQQAFPVKFSDEEPGWRTPPPALGEHTLEILENLRFDAAAVADLKKRGIV
jgi:crotonobetainyl-CoA:carnitine CoA-transferase CaiB-like acyl-CoA transferase